MNQPHPAELLDGTVHRSSSGHWIARIMLNGRLEEHDTGAVTEAGARDWLRAARLQYDRRGQPVAATARVDEVTP